MVSAKLRIVVLLGLLSACSGGEADVCPFDEDKTEPGVCGCGVPDDDADGDSVPDCEDVCPDFPDRNDGDGDGTPDGCDNDLFPCDGDADCDDGLDCTDDECDDNLCRTEPNGFCDWPAEAPLAATNLTDADDTEPSGFRSNLSAAAWNPETHTLWLGSNGGPARVWALDMSDPDAPFIPTDGDARAEWGTTEDFDDLEALTFAHYSASETLFLLAEDKNEITQWDLGDLDEGDKIQTYELTGLLPDPVGFDGAEAITFVPDEFLAAQGFKNDDGDRVISTGGLGGLMFVGHQDQGRLYAFDLNPTTGGAVLVGRYDTSANETAGLEFDRSTGLLYIWHGGGAPTLEVARLSSSSDDGDRVIDTQRIYLSPGFPDGGSNNLEGFAIVETGDCASEVRSAFLTTDDGGDWSLLRYDLFPCGWR
ncbi:MAG: hypothetical protein GY898_31410 [Proteobacteria bacterium]|nr:hypothetical protein [Pseudomonadota bacterium]